MLSWKWLNGKLAFTLIATLDFVSVFFACCELLFTFPGESSLDILSSILSEKAGISSLLLPSP